MDASFRRSYGRIPGIVALFVLGVLCVLSLSAPTSASSHLYRRDAGSLVLRQEPAPSSNSSTVSGGSTTGTPVSGSTTTSTGHTTSTTSSVSSTSTTVIDSTTTRFVSSTTSTSTSTTSISTSSIISSTSSSSSSTTIPTLTSTVVRSQSSSSTTRERTPETTFFAGAGFLPTSTVTHTSTHQDPSATQPPNAVGATSKGFWANKAAIAAVFVIVSLVVLGVGALLIINFLKKRNAARQRLLHAAMFEKYSDSPSPKASEHGHGPRGEVVYDDSRFTGAKVTSEYPFAGTGSNAISSSSGTAPQQQYQAPPSSSHGSHQTAFYTPNASQQSLSTHDHHNAAFATTPAPLNPAATTQRTHYMLPSQSQAAAVSHYQTTSRLAPPVAYRDPTQGDRTSYQPSIDSFYGGNQR